MSNPQDEFDLEDDDDDIDVMAKFIEGADMEMGHSTMEDDTDRIAKNRERKANESNLPEEKQKKKEENKRGGGAKDNDIYKGMKKDGKN